MRIATFRGYAPLDAIAPKLTLYTAIGPPIEIDHPFADGAASAQPHGAMLALVRPKLVVQTPFDPVTVAPWGDPEESWAWPALEAGAVLVGALALYGAWRLLAPRR